VRLLADQFGEHTLPIIVISASLAVITVTLAIQWLRRRRDARPATAEELRAWQEDSGRLLDQWMTGVERELDELRTAAFPDTVAPAAEVPGRDAAARACPDGPLRGDIAGLLAAGDELLRTARSTGAASEETAAAERRYHEWRDRAADRMASVGN